MRRTLAICRKELHMYFYSPTAYVAFAFYFALAGLMFYLNFAGTPQPIVDVRYVVGTLTFIFLFIMPLLTMRLVSEEFRQGTDELLLTSPASISEIIFGKYLSALAVHTLLVVGSLLYPWIMSAFGDLDQPILWLTYLGMFLIGAAMMAIGLFASSLSSNQMVAGIITFVLLISMYIIDWIAESVGGKAKEWIVQFSMYGRLNNLQKGVFHLPDILFFVTLIIVFTVLSIQVLERKRWR